MALASHAKQSPNFESNWAVVQRWGPESRYSLVRGTDAMALLNADPQHGVFTWRRSRF
jgi:hypothetical protein